MEVPADCDGVVLDILVKEGESVSEGNFATLEIEDEPQINKDGKSEKEESRPKVSAEQNEVKKKDQEPAEQPLNFDGINSGPAVRKISREFGIDLSKVIGTGKNGFITKDDVKNYIHSLSDTKIQSYAEIAELEEFGEYALENQSKIRKAGAKNLYNCDIHSTRNSF